MKRNAIAVLWVGVAVLPAVFLAACQSVAPAPPSPPTTLVAVGEFRPGSGYAKGYLDRALLPDSLALLPPPPLDGSPAQRADLAAYQTARALRDTPRWRLAALDAVLKFPQAADVFSCALDMPISPASTPHLTMLLRRTLLDAGLATYKAKDHYNRPRPFVALKEATCSPGEEAALTKDGAYPSGHAALGWAWALVLTEIAPERAQAVLARGHAFGESRSVCGVHWASDIEAGRLIGAAAVARLHADALFNAQLSAARLEVNQARAKGQRSTLDCAGEAIALAFKQP